MPKGPREKSRGPFFVREAERGLIAKAMQRANGNQDVAAAMPGFSRQATNKRMTRQECPALSKSDTPPQGVRRFLLAQLLSHDIKYLK